MVPYYGPLEASYVPLIYPLQIRGPYFTLDVDGSKGLIG